MKVCLPAHLRRSVDVAPLLEEVDPQELNHFFEEGCHVYGPAQVQAAALSLNRRDLSDISSGFILTGFRLTGF